VVQVGVWAWHLGCFRWGGGVVGRGGRDNLFGGSFFFLFVGVFQKVVWFKTQHLVGGGFVRPPPPHPNI